MPLDDDVHDNGGGRLDEEEPPIDDQFFGPGDAAHPEVGGLNLGLADDAVYERHRPERGEAILGEMADGDDVNPRGGAGGGDDEEPSGNNVRGKHKLRVHHVGGGQRAYVSCSTTAGPIRMMFHREWSPNGYDRATELFERGYYDRSHFFRVVSHFLVQFGISYTTDLELKRFADTTIRDDPKRHDLLPFREGMMSFAGGGPDSRTSQLFIAYDRAGGLGSSPWETPFGEVVDGMENVKNLYAGYGDMPPWGKGPEQGPIRRKGSTYLEENFPLLDKFETCHVERMGERPSGHHRAGEDKKAASPKDDKDTAELRKYMRGGEAKKWDVKKLLPKKTKHGDSTGEESSLLNEKASIAIAIVVFLLVVHQVLKRRKRNKRDGKSV